MSRKQIYEMILRLLKEGRDYSSDEIVNKVLLNAPSPNAVSGEPRPLLVTTSRIESAILGMLQAKMLEVRDEYKLRIKPAVSH